MATGKTKCHTHGKNMQTLMYINFVVILHTSAAIIIIFTTVKNIPPASRRDTIEMQLFKSTEH